MSTSELRDLTEFVDRVLADPAGFADRVLMQLMGQMQPGVPPSGRDADTIQGFDLRAHEELVERNLLLAAAVGACDCWGGDEECPVCAGAGTAGWTEPEPRLFAEFVLPAVLRAGSTTPAGDAADRTSPDEPSDTAAAAEPDKEISDDEHHVS